MSSELKQRFPKTVVGVVLYRIEGNSLIGCEAVQFTNAGGVDTVFRRAAISGRVEFEGKLKDHFADLLDISGDIIGTVALDRKSYGALKNRWMRCKVEKRNRS